MERHLLYTIIHGKFYTIGLKNITIILRWWYNFSSGQIKIETNEVLKFVTHFHSYLNLIQYEV
jgi:hypothetical protein